MQKAFRWWWDACPWKFVTNWRTSCEKGQRAINSQKYIKLLKEDVPFLKPIRSINCVFQEDNARPYTSKNTKTKFYDEKINVME